ncbi:MAG: NAD-dependent epimerase/dehydratase family protein [Myxococcota bacterium]
MKVLVTGATGFLGSHLSELLVNEGHQVKALVRKTSKTDLLESIGAELHLASLEAGEGLDEAVQDVDAVVHGAGLVKARTPEEFHAVNAQGARNLVEAVRRMRPGVQRFVHVSSLAAHGFRAREDEEPQPLTNYGRSKRAGEQAVLEAAGDIPVTVIRPPAIYGPRDTEMFNFFKMIKSRTKVFLGSAQNRLSLIYGPDCARAIHAALTTDHPSGRTYFVEDGRCYTQEEFARAVEEALGVRAVPVKLPIWVVAGAAWCSEAYGKVANRAVMLTRDKLNELRHPDLTCEGGEIRRELGWEPEVQLEEGARRTAQWYREHGWL